MLITEQQLREIRQIVQDHHNAFVLNAVGPESLAPEVIAALKAKGLVNPTVNSIQDAYIYGQVLAAMQDPKVANMSYEQFKAYLAKNPVPLGPVEQHAIKMAQQQAATYVVGLGNRIESQTGQVLIEADTALRARLQHEIKTKVAHNVAARESVKQLKSDLGHATSDWARDWDRIAITEKHNAMQLGVADHLSKRYGGEVLVFKRPMPDACPNCLDLHLGPDGLPRIFKLSTLQENGTNVGRKTNQWRAVVGATHPHCQCQIVRVPPGWGFNKDGDLVPGGAGGTQYSDAGDLQMAMMQEDDLRKALTGAERHTTFQGLPLRIETPAGGLRHWKDAKGNTGSTRMLYAYGFIENTMGTDHEELDCFIGPDPRASHVFVIHQQTPTNGMYDEEKLMLGFTTARDALRAYQASYNRTDFAVAMSPMPMDAFKRWLASQRPPEQRPNELGKSRRGRRLQKGLQKSGPRLVLPLSMVGGAVSPEVAAATSPAANRSPSPGTAANYLFNVPARPPAANPKRVREELDALTARPDKGIHKDPKDFDLDQAQQKHTVHRIDPPDDWLPDPEKRTEDIERNREWLEREATHRRGPKNKATRFIITHRDGDITEANKIQKAIKGEQASSHKYAARTWMKDHWVYTYAEHHGGKVEGHHEEMEQVVLKLPIGKKDKLEKFKAKHNLGGHIFSGQKYVMLNITRQEADHLRTVEDPSKKKAPKAAPKPKKKMNQTASKRLGDWVAVDPKDMKAPPQKKPMLQRGHPVTATLETGETVTTKLTGFDRRGLAVVTHNGKRNLLQWSAIKHAGDGPPQYVPSYSKLGGPGAKIVRASERHKALVKRVLSTNVVGNIPAQAYTDYLRGRGYETYLVGGVVRDMLAGTQPNSDMTDQQVYDSMKDIDIATSAPPPVHRQMVIEVGKDKEGLRVADEDHKGPVYDAGMRAISDEWGVSMAGTATAGLDIATLCSAGGHGAKSFNPQAPPVNSKTHEMMPTKGNFETPVDFDHDLEEDTDRRDFTANCLYYDPHNDVIIDPTGHGIADAQNKVLRLAPQDNENFHNNSRLPLRWWKFRARGYTADPESRQRIVTMAEKALKGMLENHNKHVADKTVDPTKPSWFVNVLAQCIYKKGLPPDVAMAKYQEAMVADGAGHLYDKYMKGLHASVRAVLKDMADQK